MPSAQALVMLSPLSQSTCQLMLLIVFVEKTWFNVGSWSFTHASRSLQYGRKPCYAYANILRLLCFHLNFFRISMVRLQSDTARAQILISLSFLLVPHPSPPTSSQLLILPPNRSGLSRLPSLASLLLPPPSFSLPPSFMISLRKKFVPSLPVPADKHSQIKQKSHKRSMRKGMLYAFGCSLEKCFQNCLPSYLRGLQKCLQSYLFDKGALYFLHAGGIQKS